MQDITKWGNIKGIHKGKCLIFPPMVTEDIPHLHDTNHIITQRDYHRLGLGEVPDALPLAVLRNGIDVKILIIPLTTPVMLVPLHDSLPKGRGGIYVPVTGDTTIGLDDETDIAKVMGNLDGTSNLIRVQVAGRLETSTADLMLDSTFESPEALAVYASHPDHVAVADTRVRPFTAMRACLDYEE